MISQPFRSRLWSGGLGGCACPPGARRVAACAPVPHSLVMGDEAERAATNAKIRQAFKLDGTGDPYKVCNVVLRSTAVVCYSVVRCGAVWCAHITC